jgi:hypothetical protein
MTRACGASGMLTAVSDLDSWLAAVGAELGLDASTALPVDLVLGVARDAAHGVARPAAPLTTFLLGRAVQAGVPLEEAVERISRLAADWQPSPDSGP